MTQGTQSRMGIGASFKQPPTRVPVPLRWKNTDRPIPRNLVSGTDWRLDRGGRGGFAMEVKVYHESSIEQPE